MTKVSPVARDRYTHTAADLHAYQRPEIQRPVPETIRDEAIRLGEISEDLQREYLRAIESAAAKGINPQRLIDLQQEMQRIASQFFDVYKPAMVSEVRLEYGLGVLGAEISLAKAGLVDAPASGVDVSFTAPDRAAMAAIANDNFADLAGQTANMTESAVAILRTNAGEILTRSIASGRNAAEAARDLERELARKGFTATKELAALRKALGKKTNPYDGTKMQRSARTPQEAAQFFEDNGIVGFVDRAGRLWDLKRYAEMAAHTKLMVSKNEGTRNRMRSAGVNHYILSDHGTDCPICAEYEGRIFWTGDGDALGYDLGPDVPIHPNCMHTTIPWVLSAGS